MVPIKSAVYLDVRASGFGGSGRILFIDLAFILEVSTFGVSFKSGLRAVDSPTFMSELHAFGTNFSFVVHTEGHERLT